MQNATEDKQPILKSTYSPLQKGTRWNSWKAMTSTLLDLRTWPQPKETTWPLIQQSWGMRIKRTVLLPFPPTSARPGCSRGYSYHPPFPKKKHLAIVQQCSWFQNDRLHSLLTRAGRSAAAVANTTVSRSWELLTGTPVTLRSSAAEKGKCKVIVYYIQRQNNLPFELLSEDFPLHAEVKYEFQSRQSQSKIVTEGHTQHRTRMYFFPSGWSCAASRGKVFW